MKRVLLCVLLTATACLAQSSTPSTLIIHDVTVIDATGAPAKPHQTVIVRDGKIDRDATTVVVLTGSGLKDPDAALKNVEPPIELDGDARTLAKVLKL